LVLFLFSVGGILMVTRGAGLSAWLRIRVSGAEGGGGFTPSVVGVFVWGCFRCPFVVWRVFSVCFGVVLLLNSY